MRVMGKEGRGMSEKGFFSGDEGGREELEHMQRLMIRTFPEIPPPPPWLPPPPPLGTREKGGGGIVKKADAV